MGERITDFITGVALLLFAFGIMVFFPVEPSLLTWIIVFVSAFAFCIGYFRLGMAIDYPMGKIFQVMKTIIFCLSGIAMIGFGIYALIKEDFNGKGLGVFSLNLIYGLAMQLYAFSKTMNDEVDGLKQSEEVRASIEELYDAFKDIDTPMGRPWIGKVRNIKNDCIIYGPTDKGLFLFGYYLFGTFTLGASPLIDMFEDPESARIHTIETQWDSNDSGQEQPDQSLSSMLPDFYISMFENYAKTGRAACDFADLFNNDVK